MFGKILVVLLLLACVIDTTDAWRRRRRRRRVSYQQVTHVVHVHHIYHHYHDMGHSSHSHHVEHHTVHHVTVHHIVHHAGHVSHHYSHHVIHHGPYRHYITHRYHSHHSQMHRHHTRRAQHHTRMARHHHARYQHHKRMARHHGRRHKHHKRMARHHRKRRDHHRRRARHHERLARHHARHGRHHLARHHRRLAHHHRRHARHHHRKMKHHRRHARHHKRRRNHHRRMARHHKRRRNHHRRMARHHRRRANHHRHRLNSILHGRLHKPHHHLGMRCYRQVRALARARTPKETLRAKRRLAHCRHSGKHVGHLAYKYHHHRNPDAWSPSCRSKRCVCRRSITHYRRALRRWEHLAERCGMVDSGCVDKRYRRVAGIRLRISMLHRKCRAHIRRPAHHKTRHHLCGHTARRYLRRQKGRRAAMMARVHKCSDEDAYCVKRLLKKVLEVNRKVHARQNLCGIKPHFSPHAKVHPSFKCHMKHEFRDAWQNALMCPSKMVHFRRWIKFWNCKRREVFASSCECSPLDTSCLRSHFTQIRHIQQRVARGRTLFTEDIRTCDECAPLKLHFMRWVHRQQVRRNRIHDSICRCPPRDLECSRRRVERIKLIQDLIRKRRAEVLALHGQCKQRGGTWEKYHKTQWHPDTLPPHPDKWVRFAKGTGEKPLTEADVVAGDLGFRSSVAASTASGWAVVMLAIVASVAMLI